MQTSPARTVRAPSLALVFALASGGCAGRHELKAASEQPSLARQPSAAPRAEPAASRAAPAPALASALTPSTDTTDTTDTTAPASCPAGMAHVKFDYCPDVERVCLEKEYDKPNHITICHRYAHEKPRCKATRVPLDFCIDEYEYPNQKGAHPPVMQSYYQASALCAAQGKRLCGEGEWVASCEGPDETPFPYGYERSADKCNFDNRWVNPDLKRVYSKDPEIQRAELSRLDRSVASGAKAGCVSGFGVFDLTGNVDEWVKADHDRPREHARFAGLKGGAWGHVRNACRPVTTSHPPNFQYYFIGLRCCMDAAQSKH